MQFVLVFRSAQMLLIFQSAVLFACLGVAVSSLTVADNSTDVSQARFLFPELDKLTFPVVPTLLMPPAGIQRAVFVWGLGVPLSFKLEEFVFGVVFKALYYIAKHPSQGPETLAAVNLPGLAQGRRRRELSEKHEGVFQVLEEAPLDEEPFSYKPETSEENSQEGEKEEENEEGQQLSRWHIYSIMEALATVYGYGGRECVLRAVCEAAETPFTAHSGIFSEVVHIVMTPSTSPDELLSNSDNEYHYAEKVGRENGQCDRIFKGCQYSLLELFTGINDPLLYDIMESS